MAGALKGADNAVAISLGTGVGGGIIIDHKIYSAATSPARSWATPSSWSDGRPCTCGRLGCWETYASATGLIKTTKEHMEKAPKDSALWTIVGGDMDKVNGRTALTPCARATPLQGNCRRVCKIPQRGHHRYD